MRTSIVPDLFIVGAPKCGTTSFHSYLAQHPEIFMSHDKEPTFFGSDIRRARRPYPTLAAYLELFSAVRQGQRAGESSVAYLSSERAPGEVKAFNPESQIVIMLRNPVDVMHSLHGHLVFIGEEPYTEFREALAAERHRRQALEEGDHGLPPYLFYRRVVQFGEQVERWLTVFGKERVHTIYYEDVLRDVDAEFARLLRFLRVDESFRPTFDRVNASRRPRSSRLHGFVLQPPEPARRLVRAVVPTRMRTAAVAAVRDLNGRAAKREPMPPDLRRSLSDELAPDVERLGRILGRDLAHWSSG